MLVINGDGANQQRKGERKMGRTVMLAGHAKLPQGMAAQSVYEMLTITVEVELKYGVIVDVSCTLATQHAQQFISRLLRGYSLQDGIEPILEAIRGAYQGKAQQALLAAAKDMYHQYQLFKERQRETENAE